MDVTINAAANQQVSALYQQKDVAETPQQPVAVAPANTTVNISAEAQALYAASENSSAGIGDGVVSPMNTGLEPPIPPKKEK